MSNAKIVYRTIQHGLKKSMGANLGKRQSNHAIVYQYKIVKLIIIRETAMEGR